MSESETMLERVARAIKAKVPDGYGMTDDEAREYARAAIEAMREPTKEMIEPGYMAMDDGVDFYSYDSGAGYSIEPNGPAEVWRAMVDAALANAPTP